MSLLKEPAIKAPWPPAPANDKFYRWPARYPVGKEKGESFTTIAKKNGVGASELVYYNFLTKDPKEINWYLANYVACPAPGSSQKYYNFEGAVQDEKKNTGFIFIPKFGSQISDYLNRLGNRIVDNYNQSTKKEPGGLCYEACYARVKEAAKQVAVAVPAFDNKSAFSRLWGSLIYPKKTWLELPEEYRGKGAPGAMASVGLGTLVYSDGIWAGNLKSGAVIQVWRVASDFYLVKDGDSPTSYGHSFLFLNYVYSGSAISAIAIADQGFQNGKPLTKGAYGYWVGANLNINLAP
jgi:hypothetical protein